MVTWDTISGNLHISLKNPVAVWTSSRHWFPSYLRPKNPVALQLSRTRAPEFHFRSLECGWNHLPCQQKKPGVGWWFFLLSWGISKNIYTHLDTHVYIYIICLHSGLIMDIITHDLNNIQQLFERIFQIIKQCFGRRPLCFSQRPDAFWKT